MASSPHSHHAADFSAATTPAVPAGQGSWPDAALAAGARPDGVTRFLDSLQEQYEQAAALLSPADDSTLPR